MIIVTGATGALNGATVDHLLESLHASEIVVVARDASKATRFAARGVEVRTGDYARPESLPAAFAGADQLLLVSSGDPGADAAALHRAAVDAAVEAGVGRVLYTSHQGSAPDNPFVPARSHAATEQALADSGLAWTSLRNGFYAHSLPWFLGPWRETGVIEVPADGPVSWTAREDAAEAAARILLTPSPLDGPVVLTARSATTFAEVAALAAASTGRAVEFRLLEEEEWLARQVAAGQPELRARFQLGAFQAAGRGFFAGTSPALEEILGREPRSVEQLLAG